MEVEGGGDGSTLGWSSQTIKLYIPKKDFWTTFRILNWHVFIYFCAFCSTCFFHRFQINPPQLQSRLGVTRTSGEYFATIVRRNFPISAIPRSPFQRYSNCQIASGIILQDLNKILFFRTTLKICQKGWGQSAKLGQLVDHFPSDQ